MSKICPCCKQPWPTAQAFPKDLEDTKDFVEAAALAAEKQDPRRTFPRQKKVISLTIRVNGVPLEAVTMDVSDGGTRVFYLSDSIPVNARVVIECDDVPLTSSHAVAVWSKQQEKTYSISGLKFV